MPDIFVSADSTYANSYYLRLMESGAVTEFAFRFADKNRSELSLCKTPDEVTSYLSRKGNLLSSLASYAAQHGVPQRSFLLQEAAPQIERVLYAQIAQFVLGTEGFYRIYFSGDPTIEAALAEVNKKRTK